MESAGLVIKTEPYRHTVPIGQRGGDLIEPLVSEQWFVKIQPLAEKALQVVRDGRIKIVPERFEKVYFHWLENIQDWCISRQLWWGPRIPAWYSEDGEVVVSRQGHPAMAAPGARKRTCWILVQQRPVAVQHAWLAAGNPGSGALLPDERDGNRVRHPLLLGGAHDHDGHLVHRGIPSTPSTCTASCETRTVRR
jgi:valyl-tRNA synthetase